MSKNDGALINTEYLETSGVPKAFHAVENFKEIREKWRFSKAKFPLGEITLG